MPGSCSTVLDERILAARPAAALYHPYISPAGERGPFIDSRARASFAGLDHDAGYHDLVRAVYEGLALAARDCYASMGPIPDEIRLGGGAARSSALRRIMASVLNRPIRVVDRPEAGAAGAAMMAAVKHGYFDDGRRLRGGRGWRRPSATRRSRTRSWRTSTTASSRRTSRRARRRSPSGGNWRRCAPEAVADEHRDRDHRRQLHAGRRVRVRAERRDLRSVHLREAGSPVSGRTDRAAKRAAGAGRL